MIFIIYILLILFLVIDFIRTRELITPSKVFNLIWFITIGLYELKLSYIQQDLSQRTMLIFILCILAYNIIGNIFYYIKFESNRTKKTLKLFNIKIEDRIKIANYIFIAIFFIEILYSKGVPLLWKIQKVPKTYMDFGIPSLHGALNGLVICLGAYTLFKKKKYFKYLYLMFGILTLSRQVLMSIVIEAVVFNIADATNNKTKINYKKYIIICIIIFIAFNALGNFRSGNDVMGIVFNPRKEYENLPTSIMWVYSYLTFSVSNFNNLVGITNGTVNYGTSTLNFFLPTVIINMVNIKQNFNTNYLVQSNFNVSTYLPEIYMDFGIIGIIIFNSLIAILGTYLYKKVKSEKCEYYYMLYAVFIHNIVFLFFVNMFIYIPIFIQFIYIPLLFKSNNEKEKKID